MKRTTLDIIIAAAAAMLLIGGCGESAMKSTARKLSPHDTEQVQKLFDHAFAHAGQRLARTAEMTPAANQFPNEASTDGNWTYTGPGGWTAGFFPGLLWYMYENTGDPVWEKRAVQWTESLEGVKDATTNHDVGFMIFCSYGNGYRLTGREEYKAVIHKTADSLSQRFSPTVGCTMSWGDKDNQRDFVVIIDNMMNLELLLWSAANGGEARFAEMAVRHADVTAANHIRDDGSTIHVINFDPVSGAVIGRVSAQGYSVDSCWARGQAWALYGYTMVYRFTGEARFLQQAQQCADYFIGHLPDDKIPYWDFRAPDLPDAKRDSSAAAIAASGLLELSTLTDNRAKSATYSNTAFEILTELSRNYLTEGTDNPAILRHMVHSRRDARQPEEHSYIYGDYYFIEALLRYERMNQDTK